MSEYLAVFEKGKRNWSAYVPDLPGCIAAAKTRAETERLLKEAISLHVKLLKEDGDPLPAPISEAVRIRVSA